MGQGKQTYTFHTQEALQEFLRQHRPDPLQLAEEEYADTLPSGAVIVYLAAALVGLFGFALGVFVATR